MNILKAIKAWWKPEVKQPKIRARFKDGYLMVIYHPSSYDHLQIAILNQQVESYKIKIGQIMPIGGGLGGLGFNG